MSLIVNTNIHSLTAQRNLDVSSGQLGQSLERLSSGLRINRSGDDPAGLSIATRLQAQSRGLNQAVRNVNNAVSLVQTAEGALNTITNISQRLRELAVQAASDENTAGDRQTLNSEATQLLAELSRTSTTSEFNGSPLLDGSYTGKLFQIGANFGQTLSFSLGDVRAKSLGSRATATGNLTDGADNGVNANIASGEVKINDQNVVTSDGDDQVSVLEVYSQSLATITATNGGAALGTTNAGTTTNASLVFNGLIQKNDDGDFVSVVGSVLFSGTGPSASMTFVASFTIGDSATTISTTGATAVSFTLFSSYASLSVIGTTGGGLATNGGANAGTTSAGTITNASLVFSGRVQSNDAGAYTSIVGSVLYTSTTVAASQTYVASFIIGDSATTISTVGATALSFTLISSYASLALTGTAVAVGTVTVANSTFTYASVSTIALANATYKFATVNAAFGSVSGSTLEINGTYVNFTAASLDSAGSIASYISRIVADINAASVTSVQAVGIARASAITHKYYIQATKGVNLSLKSTGSGIATNISLSATYATSAGTTVTYNGQSSALGKAAAVNAIKGSTSVSATANASTVTGSAAITAGNFAAGDININGVDIGVVSVNANDSSGALATAINAKTTSTGVTASVNNDGKLVLKASDGRNISLRLSTGANTALGVGGTTNANNTQRGSITLNSANSIKVSGSRVTELGTEITAKTYTADLTSRLSSVDLGTQESAAAAILTIDASLDRVNQLRADIGAIQSRLENTVSNLKIASENTTASESRIRDADFAFETARFTRNQILVQAGTAILAQANTTAQVALQLLR
jgi:flagellin